MAIAIDGPVGSGKGTLSIYLAKKLDAAYIYTGAMYRELALSCLREKTDINDEKKVLEVLRRINIELKPVDDKVGAFLNGEDVSSEIFKPYVSRVVPIVAAFPSVRKDMVDMQKKLVEGFIGVKNVIMEGRDISTEVMQDADLKIFLTADLNTRVRRRFDQLKERGIDITFNEVLKDVEDRDKKDLERKASPLKLSEDAVVVDTTNDTIEDTVNKVMEILKERNLL
ncbi:MAG: cytidylate kinase [Candidatus Levybacteria bacterium RBG_16_35_6]|nr:MAG: cytidylate kinase [Candidatus Levybacteria bacterium RBG_16_35_6]